MPKIGEAPSGEKTTLDGTEKIPLTGSVWATVSRWIAYLSGEGTLATKSYVDGIAANLGKRQRVRAATTANITISTALNNGDTLDGVSLATGDWVLVKNQSAAAENGVYAVGASPARASEFDTYNEHPGSLIIVQDGTINADTKWLCTSNVGGTLNSTAIVFAQDVSSVGNIEDLTTAETDTTKVLAPDGAGGVEFRAEAGGGGGGGALVLLEQHTASSSASLDFTSAISGTYDDYLIELIDVVPATNNVKLQMLLSTNGGSSYDTTSGHYAWNISDMDNSTQSYGGSTSDAKIGLQKLGTSNTANNGGVCGQILFHNPGSSIYKKLEYSLSFWFYAGAFLVTKGGGIYLQTTAVNAFKFLFDSGNIASGTIRVYGIAKT